MGVRNPYWVYTSIKPLPKTLTYAKTLTASPYQGSGREITLPADTSRCLSSLPIAKLLPQGITRAQAERSPCRLTQAVAGSPYR